MARTDRKPIHPLQTIQSRISRWSRSERIAIGILTILMIGYMGYFSAYEVQRHAAFQTSLDTLSVEQPLWDTLHGQFMRTTYYPSTGEVVTNFNNRHTDSLLGDHVQLSLLFLLIPYVILPKTETLYVVLSISVALGAIPMYRIARRRLGSAWLALMFAAGYLFLPAVETNSAWDIHGACFLPPLLLAALDAAETGHQKTWWALTLFAMGFREDFPLFVGWAMIWMVPRNLRKQGLVLFGLGLLFSLASFLVIIPYFGGGGTPYIVRFFPLGTPMTPSGIWSAISQLSFWQFDLTNLIAYLMRLGLPLLFLYFASLPATVAMAPVILANSLSWYQYTQYPYLAHYSAPIIPWVMVGAVDGFIKFTSLLKRLRPALNWNGLISVAVATSILTTHWMLGYSPLSKRFVWPEFTGSERIANTLINLIPKNAAITVESHLGAHLSQYNTVRFFPDVRDANWLLLDSWYGSYPYYGPPEITQAQWDAISKNPAWETVASQDGLILLKKGNGPPQNLSAAYQVTIPAHPDFNVQFGADQGISLVHLEVVHHSADDISLCTDWQVVKPSADLSPKLQFLSIQDELTQVPEYGINLTQEIFTQPGQYRTCKRITSSFFIAQRTLFISMQKADSTETPVMILDAGEWSSDLSANNNQLEINLTRLQ